ncbi:MAG: hypothetical protein ACT4PU_01825 [Planctomycetota bacterium]
MDFRATCLLSVLALWPQEAPLLGSPATAALTATELLERAARQQRPTKSALAPSTLHARFVVGLRGEDGSLVRTKVERWYTRQPERLLTRIQEEVTGALVSKGWDGKVAWYRHEGTGAVVRYSDDPATYDTDLQDHEEQLRLSRLLLESCVLDALIPRLTEVQLAGEAEHVDADGISHRVARITARAPADWQPQRQATSESAAAHPPPLAADAASEPASPEFTPAAPTEPATPTGLLITLLIDVKTGTLWGLDVPAPDNETWRLRFDFHALSTSGLRVPGNIKLYQGVPLSAPGAPPTASKGLEAMNLGLEETEAGLLLFEIDTAWPEALFAAP